MERSSAGDPGTGDPGTADLGPSSPEVIRFFGAALPVVRHFADMLDREGVRRGLIGPRELPRLWERHLVNSGAVAQYAPARGQMIDVGSGAGFPGVVVAAMLPQLEVVLIETMERRATWLREVVAELGLENVEVHRGRAEDLQGRFQADVATARAVAPLDRLAGWTLPHLRRGGVLLALKGRQARDELETARPAIARFGGDEGDVLECEPIPGRPPTYLVRVIRARNPAPGAAPEATASRTSPGRQNRRARSTPGRAAATRGRGSGPRTSPR